MTILSLALYYSNCFQQNLLFAHAKSYPSWQKTGQYLLKGFCTWAAASFVETRRDWLSNHTREQLQRSGHWNLKVLCELEPRRNDETDNIGCAEKWCNQKWVKWRVGGWGHDSVPSPYPLWSFPTFFWLSLFVTYPSCMGPYHAPFVP